VRLQAQPAQVLGLLLGRGGQVVTRADMKNAIWGTETFVDFDRGLNFCIAQIRAALGDSAESPLYVKTLPKRGYQFIAPVAPSGEAPSHDEAAVPPPRPSPRVARSWLIGLATVLAGLGVLTLSVRYARLLHRPSGSTPRTTRVAVARFDNETGDPSFDRFADALSDSVTAKLTESGAEHYGVIGNAAILRVQRNQRDLTAIGSSLDAAYVILAQVRRDSSHLFVLAHLIHLPEQTHVAVTELDCAGSDLLATQSDVAQRIAARFSPHIARLDTAGVPSSLPIKH
jgi:TolB-like protein/DNA-binding winged helix-turn-helix (wHTH) protein